ncbi:MAG: hypothetical protein MUF03_03240 [Rubrivivax sp.]|jgi:hypothetical protein|nr:hypothetical protein [Rubrivivax sp.]
MPGSGWTIARRVAATAVAALTAAGCGGPPADSGYFPLAAGHRWEYAVTTEWENDVVERGSQVLTTEGREAIDGSDAWRRRSDGGVDYWLRADPSGVYRVAAKSDLDAEPRPDPQPRYVLRAPMVAGTSWQTTTTAYLLRRRQEFPPEIRHTHPAVNMVYTIEAAGESVQTPAGRFDDCLRVRGLAQLRLFADPVVGWRDMQLDTTEWYCRGVGLVRLVRQEPARSTFITGGTITMELTRWQ